MFNGYHMRTYALIKGLTNFLKQEVLRSRPSKCMCVFLMTSIQVGRVQYWHTLKLEAGIEILPNFRNVNTQVCIEILSV